MWVLFPQRAALESLYLAEMRASLQLHGALSPRLPAYISSSPSLGPGAIKAQLLQTGGRELTGYSGEGPVALPTLRGNVSSHRTQLP